MRVPPETMTGSNDRNRIQDDLFVAARQPHEPADDLLARPVPCVRQSPSPLAMSDAHKAMASSTSSSSFRILAITANCPSGTTGGFSRLVSLRQPMNLIVG